MSKSSIGILATLVALATLLLEPERIVVNGDDAVPIILPHQPRHAVTAPVSASTTSFTVTTGNASACVTNTNLSTVTAFATAGAIR